MSGLEKLVTKARRLIADKRITRIDPGTFQVVGDHGTYIVVKGVDNAFHCGCRGYLSKGFCSHALAVTLLSRRSGRRVVTRGPADRELPPEVPVERIQMALSSEEQKEGEETDDANVGEEPE